jgi:hypothetical protein
MASRQAAECGGGGGGGGAAQSDVYVNIGTRVVSVADAARMASRRAAEFGYTPPPPPTDSDTAPYLEVAALDQGEGPFLTVYSPSTGYTARLCDGDRPLVLSMLRDIDRLQTAIASTTVRYAVRRVLVRQVRGGGVRAQRDHCHGGRIVCRNGSGARVCVRVRACVLRSESV